MKPYYMTKSQEEINTEAEKVKVKAKTKHLSPIQLYEKYAPDICKTDAVLKVLKDNNYFDGRQVSDAFEVYKTLKYYTKVKLVEWDRPESIFIVTMLDWSDAKLYMRLQSAGLTFTEQELDCLFRNEESLDSNVNLFYLGVASIYANTYKRKSR